MARAPGRRERRKRPRYIGFRVSPAVGRSEMVAAMDAATAELGLPERRRLTAFDGELGIARCAHHERELMLRAMGSISSAGGRQVTVETLVTSGTIKKVKAHLKLDGS